MICLGTALGSTGIGFLDTLSAIVQKLTGAVLRKVSENNVTIVWNLRLPRVLLAFLAGGALSCSGAVVQSVLKNPLASPFTLGVSAGAAFGAGIVIVTGFTVPLLGNFVLPATGLIFGIGTVFLGVTFASRVDRNMSGSTIVLAGMVFSLFVDSMLMIISSLHHESVQRIVLWQMGSFSMRGWSYVGAFIPFFVVGTLAVLFFCRELDMLTFGEEQAEAMGVDAPKIKWVLLILSAVLAGSAVSFCGIIGFVDLVVPHGVRRVFGSRHRVVLPLTILLGGSFMVIADLIARTIISPSELPVGTITALAGAPFYAVIYFKKAKKV